MLAAEGREAVDRTVAVDARALVADDKLTSPSLEVAVAAVAVAAAVVGKSMSDESTVAPSRVMEVAELDLL